MNKTNIEMQKLNQIGEHHNAHIQTQNKIKWQNGAILGRRNPQNPFKYFLDTQNES